MEIASGATDLRRVVRGAALAGALACALPARALDPARPLAQYPSRVWRSADGLPQDSVLRVLQTRDGHLWAATEEGLARFDGVRFTVLDTRTRPEMPGNLVYSLAEDARRRLWFGTSAGLGCLEPDGRIRTWTVAEGLPNASVGQLAVDPAGDALWVGTRDGLARMGFADGHFEVFRQADGLGSNVVWAARCDRAGRVWVGTTGGLSVREPGAGSRFRLFTKEDGLPNNVVQSLAEDAGGELWVGTAGGLARREGAARFTLVPTTEDGGGEIINSLYGDREGYLWIGGRPTVRRLRAADGRLETLPPESRGPGLTTQGFGKTPRAACGSPPTGTGRWCSCATAVSSTSPRAPACRRPTSAASPPTRRPAASGSAPAAAWPACATARPNPWRRPPDAREPPSARCAWTGANPAACVATRNKGLGHAAADGRTEWFDNLPLDINSLWQDAAGDLWAGTPEGIRGWREGRLETSPADGPLAALASLPVKTSLTDRAGNLWLGTRTGSLVRLAPDGQVARWGSTSDPAMGPVMVLHEDADNGCLWIGTLGGGLLRWKGGALRACTERDGCSTATSSGWRRMRRATSG